MHLYVYNYVDLSVKKHLKRNKDMKLPFWLLYKPSYVYIHDYNGLSHMRIAVNMATTQQHIYGQHKCFAQTQ